MLNVKAMIECKGIHCVMDRDVLVIDVEFFDQFGTRFDYMCCVEYRGYYNDSGIECGDKKYRIIDDDFGVRYSSTSEKEIVDELTRIINQLPFEVY